MLQNREQCAFFFVCVTLVSPVPPSKKWVQALCLSALCHPCHPKTIKNYTEKKHFIHSDGHFILCAEIFPPFSCPFQIYSLSLQLTQYLSKKTKNNPRNVWCFGDYCVVKFFRPRVFLGLAVLAVEGSDGARLVFSLGNFDGAEGILVAHDVLLQSA